MARPSNPPYTLGVISTKPHPTTAGAVQARGYYKDAHGKRVEVTASGKSAAAAKRALQAKVLAARDQHKGGDSVLNHDTRLTQAAEIWLDTKARERLSANTMRDYRGTSIARSNRACCRTCRSPKPTMWPASKRG